MCFDQHRCTITHTIINTHKHTTFTHTQRDTTCTTTHFFVYLLFYVFYISGHQPAELRTVSGGGRGVLQDGDVRALLDLIVDPGRATEIFTLSTQRAASLKHVSPLHAFKQKNMKRADLKLPIRSHEHFKLH